jgi:hypothetical protein
VSYLKLDADAASTPTDDRVLLLARPLFNKPCSYVNASSCEDAGVPWRADGGGRYYTNVIADEFCRRLAVRVQVYPHFGPDR